MGAKDWLGITKMQNETTIKICLEKLQFLASEMERENDRESDLKFWVEELQALESLDNKKRIGVSKALEAYKVIFRIYLKKHKLENEELAKAIFK